MTPLPVTNAESPSTRQLLEQLGLNDREIEIYMTLLSLKSGKASAIAKAAKQPRTLTYPIIQKLEEKGIVSRVVKGKTLTFMAESPRRLLSYLDDRTRELSQLRGKLEQAMPQLEQLTSPHVGSPRVTLLHGMQGMREVYRDVAHHEFMGLFNPEVMYQTFNGNIHTMLFGKDVRLKGRDLLVDNDDAARYLRDIKQTDEYQVRLLPKKHPFKTDTLVFADTIVLLSYDDQNTIVRIENQNLADSFRAWLTMLWELGRPVHF